MSIACHFDDIADFIADVRESVLAQGEISPEAFDTFANEALFGFSVIKTDLHNLVQGADIMEVGAGTLILSGYLAQKGFFVHALEPVAEGFSLFHTLQAAVLDYLKKNGIVLSLIKSPIEDFCDVNRFDYVFSINVFEHVDSIESGLMNAYKSLRSGGALRVYCPNYLFPYEPHFNIPTLFNKQLTELVFRSLIFDTTRMSQAEGIWRGLNWITVRQVRKIFRAQKPVFNKQATYQIVCRALDDKHFRDRRSGWVLSILKIIERFGLIKLTKFIPVLFSPVMDVRIQRELLKTGKA